MASRSFLSRRGDSLAFLLGRETHLSAEHLKAHDDDAKHHEHHAGGAVERFGLRLVGKNGGEPRPQQRKNDAQHPCQRVRHAADAPVSAVKVMIKTLVPTAVFSS